MMLQRVVAEVFGLHRNDLMARCRTKKVTFPKHFAMYLARELTGASLPQIGRAFNRDHATVLHACRHVKESLRQSTALVDALGCLAERFREARAAEQARRSPPSCLYLYGCGTSSQKSEGVAGRGSEAADHG
jgi:hypothetical protein